MKEKRLGRLSIADKAYIAEHFGKIATDDIARHVGRSAEFVRNFATALYPFHYEGLWASREDIRLRELLGRAAHQDIAIVLGRTPEAVTERVNELVASPRALYSRPLSRIETQDFRERYGRMTDAEAAFAFQRQPSVIAATAKRYGLRKDKRWTKSRGGRTDMPRWTKTEVDKLRQLFSTLDTFAVATALGRSTKSVISKAVRLGLRKTQARLAAMGRENRGQRGT